MVNDALFVAHGAKIVFGDETDGIVVGVYQYNGGAAKIGVNRIYTKRNESVPSRGKIGRMTLEEAEAVAPGIVAIIAEIKVPVKSTIKTRKAR